MIRCKIRNLFKKLKKLYVFLKNWAVMAETAMMAINRYRLASRAQSGYRPAVLTQHLLQRTDRLLGVILLATGNQLRFPAPELLQPLIQGQKGIEVMDIRAACRTYNVLVSENRRVAAALLFA